jgi:hypothetical protein
MGYYLGECGLTYTRRTPEYYRVRLAVVDHLFQHLTRRHKVFLAYERFQRFRAHSFRKGYM